MTDCSALTRGLFLVLIHELRSNVGNKHQINTRLSAETVRPESAYIIVFLTWHNESIHDDENDNLYTSFPCLTCSVVVLLTTSQSIADDVTMSRLLWRDPVNSASSLVRYPVYSRRYSGRSCKNVMSSIQILLFSVLQMQLQITPFTYTE